MSFAVSIFFSFYVSDPYRRIDLTLELKMRSVGLVAISLETKMSLRLKRVVLAFPTLITYTKGSLCSPIASFGL